MGKKKKSRLVISPVCFLLLLPALFLGGYGLAMELGVLPKEINVGPVTIEFFYLGENDLMILMAKVCFILLPIIFVLVAIISLIIGAAVGRKPAVNGGDRSAETSRGGRRGENAFMNDGIIEDAPDGFDGDSQEGAVADFSAVKRLELESRGRARRTKEYAPVLLKDVADNMRAYAASKGVAITEKTARAILAASVSCRVIVTDDRYRDRNKAVVGSLAHYFGGNVHAHSVGRGAYAAEQLTTAVNAEGRIVETGFLMDIYGACLDSDILRFAYLEEFDPVAVAAFFGDYRAALEGGAEEYYVPVDKIRRSTELEFMKNGRVLFPENLILMLAPAFGTDVTKMSGEVIFLDLTDVVPCEPVPYGGTVGENAYPQVMKALDRARDSYYLSEEIWKKIDALEEYLNDLIGYRFDNRKFRMMERYSSAYLAAGGSESEAIDSMLSACVFSELYPRRARFKVKSEDEDLVEFLEREFGAEAVPVSIETVRKFYGESVRAEEKERVAADGVSVSDAPVEELDSKALATEESENTADGDSEAEVVGDTAVADSFDEDN